MKCRALVVPRDRGETARRTLRERGLLREDLRILREGDEIALPLIDGPSLPEGLGEVDERDFERLSAPTVGDYRALVATSPEDRALLPRSFDVIGDIVLVRVPEELAPRAAEIGEALLRFVPGARIVGADHGVQGTDRRRSLQPIAGSGGWSTRHRENGIELEVDLGRAYFSPRLAREHARVAAAIERGDRVYDLCCGIGPFALTIARDGRAAEVTAVDSNPEAIALLRTSYGRRKFPTPVRMYDGPVELFTAVAEPVNRVILNLPREGIKYLPSVARTVARRGRLYYYEVTPRAEFERRGTALTQLLGDAGSWTVADQHVVHPFSPNADLAAFVLERSETGSGGP
ncbi:MAG: methyltransferase domain-containing protein [Thermoplasmata archaeon]